MVHDLDTALRATMFEYLAEKLSAEEFFGWLFDETWEVNEDSPAALRELVYDLELLHAQWTDGLFGESELREKMWPLLTKVGTPPPERVTHDQSTGASVRSHIDFMWLPAAG